MAVSERESDTNKKKVMYFSTLSIFTGCLLLGFGFIPFPKGNNKTKQLNPFVVSDSQFVALSLFYFLLYQKNMCVFYVCNCGFFLLHVYLVSGSLCLITGICFVQIFWQFKEYIFSLYKSVIF